MKTLANNVHGIASRYGWTEAEILRLPTTRRNKYIELIHESQKKEAGN
jgi:hypothetical protein